MFMFRLVAILFLWEEMIELCEHTWSKIGSTATKILASVNKTVWIVWILLLSVCSQEGCICTSICEVSRIKVKMWQQCLVTTFAKPQGQGHQTSPNHVSFELRTHPFFFSSGNILGVKYLDVSSSYTLDVRYSSLRYHQFSIFKGHKSNTCCRCCEHSRPKCWPS